MYYIGQSDVCYVSGECVNSPFVDEWTLEEDEGGLQACLELCRDSGDGCAAVTFYSEDDYCLGFGACLELSDSCDGCFTAGTDCDGSAMDYSNYV